MKKHELVHLLDVIVVVLLGWEREVMAVGNSKCGIISDVCGLCSVASGYLLSAAHCKSSKLRTADGVMLDCPHRVPMYLAFITLATLAVATGTSISKISETHDVIERGSRKLYYESHEALTHTIIRNNIPDRHTDRQSIEMNVKTVLHA